MSTDFRALTPIRMSDLFDGRLASFQVKEHICICADTTSSNARCLSDGENYLWVYADDDGFVAGLTRYAWNNGSVIL